MLPFTVTAKSLITGLLKMHLAESVVYIDYELDTKLWIRRAYATWFSKPNGVSYADFDAQLGPIVAEKSAALWADR